MCDIASTVVIVSLLTMFVAWCMLLYDLFAGTGKRIVFLVLAMCGCMAVAYTASEVMHADHYSVQSIQTPKDGSLIFWTGGPLAKIIKRNTGSDLSHSAIVLNGHVYEATWPKVRRVKWAVYVAEMEQHKRQWRNFDWFTVEPKRNFSVPAVLRMLLYAKSQVGKPYMLRGWWQGRETKGLFCSQYVANILEKSGLIQSANYHESPGSLYEKVKSYYDHR